MYESRDYRTIMGDVSLFRRWMPLVLVPMVRWIPALVFIHRILTAFRSDRSGRKTSIWDLARARGLRNSPGFTMMKQVMWYFTAYVRDITR